MHFDGAILWLMLMRGRVMDVIRCYLLFLLSSSGVRVLLEKSEWSQYYFSENAVTK
jgi:hypothetical protein